MPEYKCGNCKETLSLSPRAKFCPECGSSSLNMIIKEVKAEPSSKETVGVYSPPAIFGHDEISFTPDEIAKEEEGQPRKRRR